jgi:hypothetical protein
VGCDDTHPCHRRSFACVLGIRRNAGLVGQRIVRALNHSLYRSSLVRMNAARWFNSLVTGARGRDRPYKQSLEMRSNVPRSVLVSAILGFGEQFLLSASEDAHRELDHVPFECKFFGFWQKFNALNPAP